MTGVVRQNTYQKPKTTTAGILSADAGQDFNKNSMAGKKAFEPASSNAHKFVSGTGSLATVTTKTFIKSGEQHIKRQKQTPSGNTSEQETEPRASSQYQKYARNVPNNASQQ